MEIDQSIKEQYSEEVYKNALAVFHRSHIELVNSKLDLEALKSLYHKIKGGAGMLGLTTIYDVAMHGENNPEVEDFQLELKVLFTRLGEIIQS